MERSSVWNGNHYVVRDVWSDGSHVYTPGVTLTRCEYAVMENGNKIWKPCAEGVMFRDIEPLS